MSQKTPNFSGRMLLRLVVLGLVVLAALAVNQNYIHELYFTHQLTMAGNLINGSILVVFLLGLAKIIVSLVRYMREESALDRMLERLQSGQENPLKGVNTRSIIARRYATLSMLSGQYAKINHSALASTLVASESTRISFAKYVSNILILTGVFGTIVSLSIALAGASNLLDDVQANGGNMGLIIHGMSTALSTTLTAILCYLFYGYFFIKLGDAQSHLLGRIEETTSVYLLPRFSHDSDSMLHEVAGLVSSLREAATGMKQIQHEFAEAGNSLNQSIIEFATNTRQATAHIFELKQLLREGFRLKSNGD
jgi:hypothetical protein